MQNIKLDAIFWLAVQLQHQISFKHTVLSASLINLAIYGALIKVLKSEKSYNFEAIY